MKKIASKASDPVKIMSMALFAIKLFEYQKPKFIAEIEENLAKLSINPP